MQHESSSKFALFAAESEDMATSPFFRGSQQFVIVTPLRSVGKAPETSARTGRDAAAEGLRARRRRRADNTDGYIRSVLRWRSVYGTAHAAPLRRRCRKTMTAFSNRPFMNDDAAKEESSRGIADDARVRQFMMPKPARLKENTST